MKERGVLNAASLVEWKRQTGVLSYSVPPKSVILSPQSISFSSNPIKKRKRLKGLFGQNECVDIEKGIYLSTGWGLGAPALVALCEEFLALGAQSFYLVGLVGGISSNVAEGEIVYAKSAISEEGTSKHYESSKMNSDSVINLNNENEEKLAKLGIEGKRIVSTDAPFRETEEKLSIWNKLGAEVIDMETAGIYSFASYYKVNVGSLGIVADSLVSNTWSRPKDVNLLKMKLNETAIRLVKEVI